MAVRPLFARSVFRPRSRHGLALLRSSRKSRADARTWYAGVRCPGAAWPALGVSPVGRAASAGAGAEPLSASPGRVLKPGSLLGAGSANRLCAKVVDSCPFCLRCSRVRM